MGFNIEDGTGQGYLAKVDSLNRIRTFSIIEPDVDAASELGNSYNFNTGIINLTSANKSAVFYVKNNGDNQLVVPTLFYLLGNSTGGSGDVLITVLRNPTAGTIISGASDMEMNGVNRNFGSSKGLTVDAYKGQEGSTFTDGDKVIESIFNQTPTRAAISVGAIVLPKGSSIGIDITPAAGNTSLDVEFAAAVYVRSIA
jgi:hypothetical protein